MHYFSLDCKQFELLLNFSLNVLGSILYYIGSACFLPQINATTLGMNFLVVGSAVLTLAQAWKVARSFGKSEKGERECNEESQSAVWIDLCLGVGASSYLAGSYLYFFQVAHPAMAYYVAILYTFGGSWFLLTVYFMYKYLFGSADKPVADLNDSLA
jgi:hypothetical protein